MVEIPTQLYSYRFIKLGKIYYNEKGEKVITGFENKWQQTHYGIDEIKDYLEIKGNNYGVLGGENNLVIIDIDKKSPDFMEALECLQELPETYEVETPSGGRHRYYHADEEIPGMRMKNEVGEIRTKGMMVIGPNCSIDEKSYKPRNELSVATITLEQIKKAFSKWLEGTNETNKVKIIKPTDKSRSGKEWGFLCKMIETGKSKEFVFNEMKIYSKWSETGEKYKEHQYKKVVEYIEKKKTATIEVISKKYDLNSLSFDILTKIASKKRSEATETIVQEVLKKEHIYTTRNDKECEVWIYKDGIYIPDGKTFVKEICRKILREAYTTSLGNEVISKIETDTYITQEELFENKNIEEIAVENGILNIFTKELGFFTPEKRFFNKFPIEFDKKAECPAIQKHFEEVLKYSEDSKVMAELFGFLLLREYRFEKAFMFIGDGRNGKGKTLELMKRFMGIENCSSIPLQQLESDNFAMGELFNKMANISGDLDNSALNHTGSFKTLTGRDLISAARKFLNRVKFTNYAKMIFACNELPETKDLSHAFFARWVILEFPYAFVDKKEFEEMVDKNWVKIKDEKIIDKLSTKEELSGLLNLALEGLEQLEEKRCFSYSKNTAEVKKLWMRKSSSFQAFVMDNIEESWGQQIVKGHLKELYAKYCMKHKLKIESDKVMKEVLTMSCGAYGARKLVDGEQEYVWIGVRIKN